MEMTPHLNWILSAFMKQRLPIPLFQNVLSYKLSALRRMCFDSHRVWMFALLDFRVLFAPTISASRTSYNCTTRFRATGPFPSQ